MNKLLSSLPFLIILATAIIIRWLGITWGVPSADLAHAPFHPDETWMMEVIAQVKPELGEWNPVDGHREGTFSYFLWIIMFLVMQKLGAVQHFPFSGQPFDGDYSNCLLAGRYLVACCDVVTVVLVYGTVLKLKGSRLAALLAMATIACLPFEVIHAHFMRPHIVANMLLMLAVFFAVQIEGKGRWKYAIASGTVVGLAGATRYPLLLSIIVPLWFIAREEKWLGILRTRSVRTILSRLFSSAVSGTIFAAFLAFFIGVPFLFLNPTAVQSAMKTQASYIADNQFGGLALFDLSRVQVFLSHLIPYATLPYLWVLLYLTFLYLLVRPKWYSVLFPMQVFCIGYLYAMAKGYYSAPIFIRAALPIFPILAVFVGIAVYDWLLKFRSPAIKVTSVLIVIAFIGSSLCYDIAYVNAMRNDSRLALAERLRIRKNSSDLVRIGLYRHRHNYFMVTPTLSALSAPKVYVDERETFTAGADRQVEYIINTAFEIEDYQRFKDINNWLKSRGHKLEKDFSPHLSFLGFSFDNFTRPPHDLLYPLPRIALWKVSRGRPKAVVG